MRNGKAIRYKNVLKMQQEIIPFDGIWKDSLGSPAMTGTWLIWGHSSNGKTAFAIQLAKHLSHFGKVAYNSLEEGISRSLQLALQRDMSPVRDRYLYILDKEFYTDLWARLEKRRSPDFIIIDSFQYMGLNFSQYTKLTERFSNKLFIFISHADGKMPEGRVAKRVRFDAGLKIWVEGFKAFPAGRYGGGEPYVIWQEGADKYWKGGKT